MSFGCKTETKPKDMRTILLVCRLFIYSIINSNADINVYLGDIFQLNLAKL